MFSTIHEVCFDRARVMFRLCSWFVSSGLEVGCDHIRDVFQPCLMYFSTVAPGMFRQSLEVCFDRVRVEFSTAPKVCFNRA